jgi:hypothetical protein
MPAPRLNPQNIGTLKAADKRTSHPAYAVGDPFKDLTWSQQRVAEQYLWKWCKKWGADLPQWRRAILIGTAKRLALHPPAPNFGYKLRAYYGAKYSKLKYQFEKRPLTGVIAMHAALKWKREGRPPLPSGQLPV